MATYPGWESDILGALGDPLTQADVAFLDKWQSYEGGTATFNPLNTTQTAPGATDYNSVGVKNYPDAVTGTTATVQTLRNGRYNELVAALASGNPTAFVTKSGPDLAAAESQLKTWGTTGFAAYLLGQASPGVLIQSTGGVGQPTNAVGSVLNAPGAAVQAVTGDIPGILGKFLKLVEFIFSYRFLEIVGGGLLVLLGLYILSRQLGVNESAPAPAKAAAKAAGA